MVNQYNVGSQVRITGTFTNPNASDDPVDPTTITIYYKDPSGNITELSGTDSDVTNSSTGVYYTDITIDESGTWIYRFVGTGAAVAADEGYFLVEDLFIDTA